MGCFTVVERTEISGGNGITRRNEATEIAISEMRPPLLRYSVLSVPSASSVGYCSRFDAVSQFEFVQRLQSLPTNIFAACLSPLNCHRSQFDATFAHSPPPG